MRDAAELTALLVSGLLALAIFGDDEPETDDLPKCPDVIPDWMLAA